jgi:membrane protein implicated in regulation of membrane protease activity
MPDLLTQLTSFTVFAAIAALGFCFLLASLLFGEIFGHFGDFDHDLDHGPTFFSPRVLSVFVTAFGASGAIAVHYGLSSLPASLIGFLNGVLFGTMIYWFARFLHGQQASTHVEGTDLVGKVARVTVAIPADGVGQVRVQLGDELVDKVAKSRSGEAIRDNHAVVIEQVLGEIVVVRPQ